MSGMAEVIAAHQGYETLTRIGGYTVDCLGCDWRTFSTQMPNEDLLHAAHVADELTKAGYGHVQEAKEWAFGVGYLMAETDMAPERATGEKPERTNPYREGQPSKS